MTSTSVYPWDSLSNYHKPDRVIIAYTNSSEPESVNVTSIQDINNNQTITSSSSSWWWSGYPSGYSWPHIISASLLITVCILVIIIGNFLVIWAIIHDRNLKVTQNWFIASLACADLFIGLLVLPFSLTNELLGYWPFGVIFCEIYKATDVLLCTASIMSLCLISLDRYWSITRAVTYARQRTQKRAIIMIFTVWFISAVVCIPPLIGWNKPTKEQEWPLCLLSEDIGYVIYSACGSFFIPAFIMVFVYGKIYQAAKERARRTVATKKSDKITQKQNSTESSSARHDDNANCNNTCMISVENTVAFNGNTTEETALETVHDTANTTSSEDEVKTQRQHKNANEVVVFKGEQEFHNLLNTAGSESNKDVGNRYCDGQDTVRNGFDPISTSDTDSLEPVNKGNAIPMTTLNAAETATKGEPGNGTLQQFSIVEIRANGTSAVADTSGTNNSKRPLFASIRMSLFPVKKTSRKNKQSRQAGADYGKCTDFQSAERHKKKLAKARERRATVVLGLVMAAFILCWLPFFAIYVVSAICSSCIPPTVATVFFWIGYFNSALNPIIYTIFNREFRRAFQKIIFGRKNGRR